MTDRNKISTGKTDLIDYFKHNKVTAVNTSQQCTGLHGAANVPSASTFAIPTLRSDRAARSLQMHWDGGTSHRDDPRV